MQPVTQEQERTYWQLFWTPERVRTVKIYARWWIALAYVGSLFCARDAKMYPEALWNPLAWNLAGLVAWRFTSWQLRSGVRPLRKTDFDKIFIGGASLFLALRGFNLWEILLRNFVTPLPYHWLFWGSMVIIGLCISIWRVLKATFFTRVSPI